MTNVINNPKIRVLEVVRRWGIVPMLHRRSIAEHMYFVAMYAMEICEWVGVPSALRYQVLTKAIKHDVPEVETGDISGPVKRRIVVPELLETYEQGVLKQFGIEPQAMAALEKAILKAADYIDASWEIAWEVALGNRIVANLLDPELSRAEHWFIQVEKLSGVKMNHHWMTFEQTVRDFAAGRNQIEWATDPK